MDEVANPNPNPNPEPNPNPNPNPNPRPAAARPPARACRPVRLGAQAGCYYGPEGGRRSCKRERHDLQVPINTPYGAGLPQRARAERPRRMHATEGLGLGLRSGASPKVADSTAFDLTLTLAQEEEIFGLSFEEVLAQEKGAGFDLRGSGGMAASLR